MWLRLATYCYSVGFEARHHESGLELAPFTGLQTPDMSSFSEEAHSCSAVPNGQFSGTTASCQLSLSTDHSPIHPLNYFVHVREKWSKMIKNVYTAYKMRIIHVQYSLILTHELPCLYRYYLMNAYFSMYILLYINMYIHTGYIYIYILFIYLFMMVCGKRHGTRVSSLSSSKSSTANFCGLSWWNRQGSSREPWGIRQLNQPRINLKSQGKWTWCG